MKWKTSLIFRHCILVFCIHCFYACPITCFLYLFSITPPRLTMKKHSSRQSITSRKGYSRLLGATAVVAFAVSICMYYYYSLESPTREPSPSSTHSLSPYDQYVMVAKSKHWFPVDPVEKLTHTIELFGQRYDPSDMKGSSEILQMHIKEFEYILGVLRKSTDRTFDLSFLMSDLIEMAQRSKFKSLKEILRSGRSGISYRKMLDTDMFSSYFLYALPQVFILRLQIFFTSFYISYVMFNLDVAQLGETKLQHHNRSCCAYIHCCYCI